MGKAANLVVHGNVSLTIKIVLSERATEFSAVVYVYFATTHCSL